MHHAPESVLDQAHFFLRLKPNKPNIGNKFEGDFIRESGLILGNFVILIREAKWQSPKSSRLKI